MDKKAKILHICSYFSGISRVYENLFKKIDENNYPQDIYVPYRVIKRSKTIKFSNVHSNIIWRPILSKFTRLAYFYKINKIYKDTCKSLPIKDYDVIHAHTWFTDGGVAYKIHKKYNIPYVITVRGTDLHTFVRFFYHIHPYGRKILCNAKKIIFVSSAYERKVLDLSFLRNNKRTLMQKSLVLPNGIDDFWMQNIAKKKKKNSQDIKLIYIGSFLKLKNVNRLINAVNKLNDQLYNVSLTIVGGGRESSKDLIENIQTNNKVNFIGKIKDRAKLAKLLRESDIFTMPSYNETFGLVYIEALSQGIPVLYSKNEGIDGFYDNIGEAVDPFNVDDIAKGILKINNNYEKYDFDPKDIVCKHDWSFVARTLCNIYQE